MSVGRPAVETAIVDEALLSKLTAEVAAAAVATLAGACNVRIKADRSPVTDADERSQAILLQAMARLMPGVAVVSEEMAVRPSRLGDVFVLIDPLGGTKEFVAGSSEYTVNLAIVHYGEPRGRLVAGPADGGRFLGRPGRRAPRPVTAL